MAGTTNMKLTVTNWAGDEVECDLDAAVATGRQLWRDAVEAQATGRCIINFYLGDKCLRTVNHYRELREEA